MASLRTMRAKNNIRRCASTDTDFPSFEALGRHAERPQEWSMITYKRPFRSRNIQVALSFPSGKALTHHLEQSIYGSVGLQT